MCLLIYDRNGGKFVGRYFKMSPQFKKCRQLFFSVVLQKTSREFDNQSMSQMILMIIHHLQCRMKTNSLASCPERSLRKKTIDQSIVIMSTGSGKNQSKAPAASLATSQKKGPRPGKRGRRKGDGKPLMLTCEDWHDVCETCSNLQCGKS